MAIKKNKKASEAAKKAWATRRRKAAAKKAVETKQRKRKGRRTIDDVWEPSAQ